MIHLFENFLEDHKTYVLTENFWSTTIGGMLVDKSIPIKRWLATKNNNGRRFFDGDPIFSLIDYKSNRALRIVQLKPKSNEPFIKSWVEKRLDQEDNEIDVLAITLELSEETKQIVLELVTNWFVKKISLSEFNKSFIDNNTKKVLSILDLKKMKRIQSYYFNWLENQTASPSEKLRDIFTSRVTNFLKTDVNTYFYDKRLSYEFTNTYEKILLKAFKNIVLLNKPNVKMSNNEIADVMLIHKPSKSVILISLKKNKKEIHSGKDKISFSIKKIEKKKA
jgi:hypothetical protein